MDAQIGKRDTGVLCSPLSAILEMPYNTIYQVLVAKNWVCSFLL